ncbi:fatty-acid amide hydrolase 2 isoform X2 [Agrilus planipennis]|uniref:Fatty-acid amide hydrolase 2 isoform X2 n=1 Tax=Agrilus planipennis TaxID=224129 RepID=A0A7F5R571_AGRPL|nr:fatty-acid amide hydrolase 2 isoform X2 [Agrilus planipennis]
MDSWCLTKEKEMGVLRGTLILIVAGFTRLVGYVAQLVSFITHHPKRVERLPPINDDILLCTAKELAEKIRKRKVSSEAVIRAYIRRVKAVDPIINAVVEDRFEEALEEAKAVDKLIASETFTEKELQVRYPLLGLPLTVKESLAVKGCSNAAGQTIPERPKATSDAVVVEKCRNAGAIPILVSNTPELCLNWETFNKVTGRSKNPYDTRRTCGGSSGGEAALIASGASLIGLGSDICGSLRLPPLFCGIWGHKPSPHAISIDGHYPSCDDIGVWKRFFAVGPLTRYASDLPLMFRVLMNEEMNDHLRFEEQINVSDLKVYFMLDDHGSILTNRVCRHTVGAVQKVVQFLGEKHLCRTEKAHVPKMRYSSELGYITLLEIESVDHFFKENEKGAILEFFLYFLCMSPYSFYSICYSVLRCVIKMIYTKGYKRDLEHLRHQLMTTLGDNGVLIYPCYTGTAHYHGGTLARLFDASYMTIFNALGFPATSCTVGHIEEGIPIGVQVVAAPNNDKLTIAVAQAIEAHFGGWKPPPADVKNPV